MKTALDSVETARNNRRIDRLIRSASDAVDTLTLRRFYPMLDTRTKDWLPELDTPMTWRLWLDDDEMAAAPTAVTVAGTAVTIGDVYARPDNGPPFDHLELNRAASSAWSSGATSQRSIAITGVFGYNLVEVASTTLAAAISSTTATSCTIAASWEVGVGSLLRVGDERLNVVGRSMTTTGQTLQVPVDSEQSSTEIRVTNGAAFVEDEVILLDAEKMRVDEIAGNTLTVTRAVDGSALASHTGSTVYAARSLTVERGACGTTAAEHLSGATVYLWRPPDLINQLAIAETIAALTQESAAYALTVGSGDNAREAAGRAVEGLRKRVKMGFYRVRDR